uniref:Uncharacterized protein n=1 Tax=Arundo donax TaxID=35708 RepID=A0A0A9E7L9_ARUDO
MIKVSSPISLTRIMERLAKSASNSPGPTSSSATPWSPSTTASFFFRPCKNPPARRPSEIPHASSPASAACTTKARIRSNLQTRNPAPGQAAFHQTSAQRSELWSGEVLTTDAARARNATTATTATGALGFRSIPAYGSREP